MREINLLPPEAFKRLDARKRRVQIIIIAVLYAILLAGLSTVWSGRVDRAEDKVALQENQNSQLQGRVAALAEAQTFVDDYDANARLLTEALQLDMSWGRLLNDFARMIPDRVWLESFSGIIDESGEGPLGSITVSGIGFAFPDVSAWLRSLDSDRFPGVTGAWVQTVSETEIGPAEVVTFSSTTSLTDRALSDRLADRVPVIEP